MELTTFGHGYGYGYGSGSGDGSGYGYGYGSDDERTRYLGALISKYEARYGGVLALWRSNSDGTPANGGGGKSVAIGDVQQIVGPLYICTRHALHGTTDPTKWKGERWWVIALFAPTQTRDDKIASLKRTIIADLGTCPFD